ncbi:hypothetical protein PYW07_002958 [Mythimna separata]|uniref:Ral GTPase-activating protein subunit alpha/beta N-terminal domain-containing protein n=1 Tax=Mythimna separata TaxID=271217 RepID=A0AAD7YHC1_MYTSE|nr:hypothetical protein PYW07_002958 [Mythimna separata]
MNVSIFNRVNNQNKDSGGMYSEWSSLPLEGGGRGVLGAVGGRDVVLAVVKQLASHEPSPLTTDAEVEWVLEVIRFGLSLPLVEHEALRDCVRVCCAWLAPLLPPAPPAMPPPPALPPPVAAAPHKYARKILRHLHNLFVPRPNESGDLISKQAVLCHRVLRLSRALADGGALGAREWKSLLLLLLAAASALLSPPAPHHSAAEQLCERVLCVLFEVWILACHRCFPVPPLWRTLREQCVRWRHRAPLTEQWTRASLALTARLLKHMYGPLFPIMPISEEDANLIPADMSAEAVMQSWYRMLHTIGNPVDLCRPHVISQTPDFLQYSITQDEGSREPSQHPCLQALPSIFHKAMKGIAAHVDAFLGRGSERWWAGAGGGAAELDDAELTPPAHRRLAKSFSVSASRPRDKTTERSTPRTSLIGLTSSRPPSVVPTTPPNSISSQVGESEKPPLTPLRPKVNSIFHLFGEWLFEAALIGTTPAYNNQQRTEGTPPPPSLTDAAYKLNMLSYQPGRAEALGTLCRVLCSKQCREEVLAPYLARCYAALHRGLRDPATAASVVYNAPDIFRLDLDGVLVLVPDFVTALDQILSEREPKLECGSIDKRELRKAAISALLSLVAFPYHYKGLPVPEFPGCNEYAGMTLGDFTRGKISLICVSAVQVETMDALCVPLLSALYLCVRHNAHAAPGKAHSAPPGSTLSHSTDYKARSESGSAAGSAEGHSLDDFAADVRELDPSSPVFGAALVVRATYLVCHRLISSWKGDLQVSLAALELLSGLAKLHSSKPEAIERKRAVRWICDYITVQCSRPPQAHSRDLHSCVVAAYTCLSAWLCPALLADQDCIATLLEVVELGISGSKSQGKLRAALVRGGRLHLPQRLAVSRTAGRPGLHRHAAGSRRARHLGQQESRTASPRCWKSSSSASRAARVKVSFELHSCVVAAYTCLSAWLCPALLADQDCIATLLEVVELGISGSKSQGKLRAALVRGGRLHLPQRLAVSRTAGRPGLHRHAAGSRRARHLGQQESRTASPRCWKSSSSASRAARVKVSFELHSCVVAAYTCLSAWLCPALLADQDCIATLLEVVELGISGSKSQGKPGEPPKMKDEKELKPVSMRVRDAAESLLMLILEQQIGNGGNGSSWCRLDERWLAALGHGRLRHFVADGNILLSLLEEPLSNSQEPQPTLIVIIRCGWGRYAWSLSARGAARSAGRGCGGACARPVDMRDSRPAAAPVCRPLPHAPPCALDSAFPSLEAVLRQLNDPEAPTLFKLLEAQAAIEKKVKESEDNVLPEEYIPPEPVTEFQTARLFLSHFGYLNIGGDKKGALPRLVALDDSAPGFASALRRVDACGARACVTVHVFCARAGQLSARDIVHNARSLSTVPPAFVRMLRGLGNPVLVRGHPGWAGHVDTSYDARAQPAAPPHGEHAPAIYDAREQVLYWSDSTNEIAFVVPSGREPTDSEDRNDSIKSDVDGSCLSNRSDKGAGSCWDVSGGSSTTGTYSRSVSESERAGAGGGAAAGKLHDKLRALSLDLDKQPAAQLTGSGRRNRDYTTKILIIWLEDFEDHLNLPIDDLLPYCETGLPWRRHEVATLCVSARRCGLVRVRATPAAGVLADGALLAPRLLPDCLRRAALDAARRTRLNTDLYQPPHVRRRHLIQELAQQYKKDLTEPELLESLFRTPA